MSIITPPTTTSPGQGRADRGASNLVQQVRAGSAGLATTHRVIGRSRAVSQLVVTSRSGATLLDLDLGDSSGVAEWSPTGDQLAYIGPDAAGIPQLYLFTPDPSAGPDATSSGQTGHVRALTSLPVGLTDGHLNWAPDGSCLVVTGPTRPRRDPAAPYRVTRRVWHHDEHGLIDGGCDDICVVGLDGTLRWLGLSATRRGPRSEAAGLLSAPRWSPNGDSICYLQHFADPTTSSPCPALMVWSAADGTVAELVDCDWGWIDAAIWAPDGQTVLVLGSPLDPAGSAFTQPAGIWAIRPDGRHHLTGWLPGGAGSRMAADTGINWPAAAGNLRLLPDQRTLLFTAEEAGHTYIASVDLRTGRPGPYALRPRTGCWALLDIDKPDPEPHASPDDPGNAGVRLLLAESALEIEPRLVGRLLTDAGPAAEDADDRTCGAKGPHERPEDGRHRHFQIPSGDYLIDAWVVLPAGGQAPFPTVLKIHGGPYASIGDVYGADVAALVEDGIAVVFHNFRGSYGYSRDHADLIRTDWGRLGEGDHHAVLDHLVDLGLADPDRLGVMGHSHGGFATCWLIGRSRRFAAAISENPVANFHDIFYTADIGPWLYSKEFDTTPTENPEPWLARSPLQSAHQCTTPTLLIQSDQDLRCPAAQTDQMYTALWQTGCPVEMLRFPLASHSTSYTGSHGYRSHRIDAVTDWFTEHLSSDGLHTYPR